MLYRIVSNAKAESCLTSRKSVSPFGDLIDAICAYLHAYLRLQCQGFIPVLGEESETNDLSNSKLSFEIREFLRPTG